MAHVTPQYPLQVYNYMRPEVGAVQDADVTPDPKRHLYIKSGFLTSHPKGTAAGS